MTWPDIVAVDYHTAGEPFRIVPDPPIAFPGARVAERRDLAASDPRANALRGFLALEPRGFDGMYGGFIVPPDDDGADLGVLFWHRDGFSKACGHGSIALATWAFETGLVEVDADGYGELVLDVPAGRVQVRLRARDGELLAAAYDGLPVHVVELGRVVPTEYGPLSVDTLDSGHPLLAVDIGRTSLDVTRQDLPILTGLYREIRRTSYKEGWPLAPAGIAVFYRRLAADGLEIRQRGVAIYGNGQLDRSPCGTGTAALTALLRHRGELTAGGRLTQLSLVGSSFTGTVNEDSSTPGGAIAPRVEGRAYRSGEHRFVCMTADPFDSGFTLGDQ
ncbi:proline racemase family protein [Streptomyces sp. NPDC002680]|uniref:proline racemase family protein n=1 Tax=Streptomyces sp. NPDC002680 TaxID=3364659 RepID=UPI0036CAA6AF